jgi:DNA mismatch repair protein MLH3
MIPIVDESRHLSNLSAWSPGSEDVVVESSDYDSPHKQMGFIEAFKKWERT